MTRMPIGALATATGVKVPTIRYYESIGLLPAPDRTEGNRRAYGAEEVNRVRFVRHARDLGFEVPAIRQLLALADDPANPCADADTIARDHLRAIDRKIAMLTGLRAEVARMVDECARGRISECRVIEVLADHDLCLSPEHGALAGAGAPTPPPPPGAGARGSRRRTSR